MDGPVCNDPEEWNDSPVIVDGALIVGAGPAGLATAAALQMRGIPSMILEREDCIASLWKKKTYDRLHLHIPKQFCALPHVPFPNSYPQYPSRDQVVAYLEMYAETFQLKPLFQHTVTRSVYKDSIGAWRVTVEDRANLPIDQLIWSPRVLYSWTPQRVVYQAKWLVVASGENSQPVWPQIPGDCEFKGKMMHSSSYKNGFAYRGKRVLVVGSGNSGMEISLDLANHKALPSMAVRGEVHVVPRDVFGISTFYLTFSLLKRGLPVKLLDMFLLFYSWVLYGDLSKLGLVSPAEGPMEVKMKTGQTPVLDVGALSKIKSRDIQVLPGVVSFNERGATFADGKARDFDAIILATGYRSTVCSWLEGGEDLFHKSGHPKMPFPSGWKGEKGLFAAGLTRRGLQGVCHDAEQISKQIAKEYTGDIVYVTPFVGGEFY